MSLGTFTLDRSQLLRSSCSSVDVIAPGAGGTQSLHRVLFTIPRTRPASILLLRGPLLKSNYNC